MPKRTRKPETQEINQFAASVVAQATAEKLPVDLNNPAIRSQIMRAVGSRGGLKGARTLNAQLQSGAAEGFRSARGSGALGTGT